MLLSKRFVARPQEKNAVHTHLLLHTLRKMRRFGLLNVLRSSQQAAATVRGATPQQPGSSSSASCCGAPPAPAAACAGASPTATWAARWASTSGATPKKDFYETLGVTKTANESEIKKAYRKKAMDYHPDRPGGNKDKFAALSEAYEVLSDTQKRQVYDQYGAEAATQQGPGGMGGMGGMGGRSPEDIFAEFFRSGAGGGMDPFGGGGGGGGQKRMRVADIDTTVTCSLEELFSGTTKTIRVQRPISCATCKGSGSSKGKEGKKTCAQCNGAGREVQQVRMGPGMVQQLVQDCRRCNGTGKTIAAEDVCKTCRSEGYSVKSEEMSIHIPAGVSDGNVMVMRGMAGDIPGAEPGDINVQIQMRPHSVFKRMGKDLIVNHTCSLSEALLGMEVRLTMPDGRTVVAASPENSVLKPNCVISLPGLGMPAAKEQGGGSPGNLYVVVNVKMPNTLNKEQRAQIEATLGKPSRDAGAPEGSRTPGKLLTQSFEELSRSKANDWAERPRGGGNGGRGGQRGGPQQGAECVQQ